MAAAVVGGTAAELGGGKFANGAVSAAFTRLFNEEARELEYKTIARKNAIVRYDSIENNSLFRKLANAIGLKMKRPTFSFEKMQPVVRDLSLQKEFAIQRDSSGEIISREPTGNYREIWHNPTEPPPQPSPQWVWPMATDEAYIRYHRWSEHGVYLD